MESECLTVVMEEKRQNRIGIITMYYNSSYYGGLLQAYALCKYLNDSGYPTKQITYDFYRKTISSSKDYKNLVSFLFKRLQKRTNNLIIKTINIIHGVSELRKDRRNICAEFRASIPHTETVYNDNSIEDCNNLFDIFIAGSDQVWNPDVFRPSFFLSFVNEEKKKISYAASIGNSITGKEMQSEYEDALNKFDRISVREKSDINKLEDLCKKRVEWVVDPVFLLTEKQWETVSSPVQLNINKEYIFCYFLGDDKRHREIAQKVAIMCNCAIVTIPYMQMNYRKCDSKFGDEKLLDLTPAQFLYLVKNAKGIFTDSFHATAFSIIFNKWFITFGRTDHPRMNERITSITSLYNCGDRCVLDYSDDVVQRIFDKCPLTTNCRYESQKALQLIGRSKEFLLSIGK